MFVQKRNGYGIILFLMVVLIMAMPAWGQDDKKSSDEKIAVVNGAAIMKSDFDGEVLRVQRTHLALGRPLKCAHVAAYDKEVLEGLIRLELLYQESRKAGIKIDKAAVDRQMEDLKKQFLSETEYRSELSRRQITEDMLRARLERDYVFQKYVEQQFAEKIKVSDADMITYYESHLDLLKQPLQVRVSHILIQSDPKWDKERKQEARWKIESIQKKVEKGQDFAVLAREHSDGTARTNGGDLGYIRAGQLGNRFEKVVFELKPGETSSIMETDHGFHLFKVTDRKAETILAYDHVKEQIRQTLLQEKKKQAADLHGKKLRETAKVEIFLKENVPGAKP
jgi:peptidyl-prolyl cis-trans isomerase C